MLENHSKEIILMYIYLCNMIHMDINSYLDMWYKWDINNWDKVINHTIIRIYAIVSAVQIQRSD